jgi:hypothetical protein
LNWSTLVAGVTREFFQARGWRIAEGQLFNRARAGFIPGDAGGAGGREDVFVSGRRLLLFVRVAKQIRTRAA